MDTSCYKLNVVISFDYTAFMGLAHGSWATVIHRIPHERLLLMIGHLLCEGFSDREQPTTFKESVELAFTDLAIPDRDMDHIIKFLYNQCEFLAHMVPDVGTLYCRRVVQEDNTSTIYLFAEHYPHDNHFPVKLTIGPHLT